MKFLSESVADVDIPKKFTVANYEEYKQLKQELVTVLVRGQANQLAEILKKKILEEYQHAMAARVSSMAGISSDEASNSIHIIEAIRDMKVVKKYTGGKYKIQIKLKSNATEALRKGLIKAINDGTGVFNEENPRRITAKNKYMFIPLNSLRAMTGKTVIKKGIESGK